MSRRMNDGGRTRDAGGRRMEIEDNRGDGQSVLLFDGDDLDEVPDSHRDLITPSIREGFADPPAHFRRVARRCPFPQMAVWLRALLRVKDWELALHRGDPPEWTAAGFTWKSAKVYGAEITPSSGTPPTTLPAVLRDYYSLVDKIRWMPFGLSGGL